MNNSDLLEFLPCLHCIDKEEIKNIQKEGQRGFTKYQILKLLSINTSTQNYGKLNECIVKGFLKCVNDNPPQFLPDKDKIWEFWKETGFGAKCMEMVGEHSITLW